MKIVLGFVSLAFAMLGAGNAGAASLEQEVKGPDGWLGYRVPMISGAGQPCCYEWHGDRPARAGCNLDGRNWNFGTSDAAPALQQSDQLAVYLHVAHGAVDKVRAVSAACPVHTERDIRWLEMVTPGQSIAMLEPLVAAGDRHDDAREPALAALAYHDERGATEALARLAQPDRERALREQALFWLGQARGAPGADIVEHWATTDAEPELRAHAVFALSQSKGGDPYLKIKAISESDRSEHVRSQALFWMAQMKDHRAEADITARVRSERSREVQEQAVFALSQLGDRADEALIGIIQGDYPRDAKEKALFWLGQSGSQKAIDYFDRVLAADTKR